MHWKSAQPGRRELCANVEYDLSLPAVVRAMVDSKKAWGAVLVFYEDIFTPKEAVEKQRGELPT